MTRFTLSQPNQIRGDQLAAEIREDVTTTATPTVDDVVFYPPSEVLVVGVPEGDEPVVQGVVSAHVPQAFYFPEDYERQQAQYAGAALAYYKQGLGQLSAADKAYAILGRVFAIRDGADEGVVLGIVDRATAVAYITSKAEWQGLPASAKAWIGDELEALALVLQALLLVM